MSKRKNVPIDLSKYTRTMDYHKMTKIALSEMTADALKVYCNNLCRRIELELPQTDPKTCFVLIVFDDPSMGQYMSNGTRETMIAALRETLQRLENQEDTRR